MIRTLTLLLTLSIVGHFACAQFVCPPCQASCDELEFSAHGKCPHCGMTLIMKADKVKTEEFSFSFENIRYSAEIGFAKGVPKGTIVIVPGHGKTDFVNGRQYYQLKQFFTQLGFNTLSWDKRGCGKSEGEYLHHQSVKSSADESIAAIQEFKRKQISGGDHIGLWGISRAGWICPLIIENYQGISFWISVSGTDQFDTFRYMIETNFPLEGRSADETKMLMNQFDHYLRVLRKGGQSYAELVESTKELFNDPFYKSLGQKIVSEKDFAGAQDYYKTSGDVFDEKTGLLVFVPHFEKTLNTIKCPVLALFGELDSQVDWRKTKMLYENTIRMNGKLDVKVFPACNHNMNECVTGAQKENLDRFNWATCDGYYDAMRDWLAKTIK